jgi:hypothetical protein
MMIWVFWSCFGLKKTDKCPRWPMDVGHRELSALQKSSKRVDGNVVLQIPAEWPTFHASDAWDGLGGNTCAYPYSACGCMSTIWNSESSSHDHAQSGLLQGAPYCQITVYTSLRKLWSLPGNSYGLMEVDSNGRKLVGTCVPPATTITPTSTWKDSIVLLQASLDPVQ